MIEQIIDLGHDPLAQVVLAGIFTLLGALLGYWGRYIKPHSERQKDLAATIESLTAALTDALAELAAREQREKALLGRIEQVLTRIELLERRLIAVEARLEVPHEPA
jgi:hypothetical protein